MRQVTGVGCFKRTVDIKLSCGEESAGFPCNNSFYETSSERLSMSTFIILSMKAPLTASRGVHEGQKRTEQDNPLNP